MCDVLNKPANINYYNGQCLQFNYRLEAESRLKSYLKIHFRIIWL